jgi:hypothetical protein
MKRRLLLFSLMLAAIVSASDAATLPEAFSQGTQFGQSGNAAARGRIDAGTASTTVPGYTTTAPAASYFGGPGLGTPSASTLANCTTTPQDPACQAVNFSQTNPAQRPTFTIAPNNPMLVRSRTITADPSSIAGSLAGTYSACTTQTVNSPDIFTSRTCNEYRAMEQHTCSKTLTVSVTDNGLSCNYGDYLTPNPRIMLIRPFVFVGAICAEDIRFQWIWGYSECNGTSAAIFTPSVMPGPEYQRQIVSLGCGGTYYVEGGCPNGNCSYNVGLPNANPVCTEPNDDGCNAWDYQDLPLTGFSFQRPVHTYTFTEAWDNQCANWEARLP